jgi:predicted DCC family thiol-disulfide oxidoreductase YuxK
MNGVDAIPGSNANHPVILFDGLCNLCNAWVRFVVRHDPAGIFRFAAQQSIAGQALIKARLNYYQPLSSVILVRDNVVYTESTAVLEIFKRLDVPRSWIALLKITPKSLRDAAYRFVVRHRYQWFGQLTACQDPPADIRARFIV